MNIKVCSRCKCALVASKFKMCSTCLEKSRKYYQVRKFAKLFTKTKMGVKIGK